LFSKLPVETMKFHFLFYFINFSTYFKHQNYLWVDRGKRISVKTGIEINFLHNLFPVRLLILHY
jgi:hypothetical protein